jgi:serum/glucocorticoid-regulated kinase 2
MHTDWKRPEYPAPEVLADDKYSKAADWWTLDVVLYEMLTGLPPFYSNVLGNIRDNIISKPLHIPRSMHANAKNIISRLRDRGTDQRLGANVNGASEVRHHAFFKNLDCQEVIERKTEPSFRPSYYAGAFGSYSVDHLHTVGFGQLEEPPTTGMFLGFGAPGVSEPGINAIDVRTGASMFGSIEENANTPIVTDENMNLGTVEQLRTVLEVALQSDQQDRVALLLGLKLDLDTPIFQHTSQRSTMLTWVISHESLGMLILILSKADVKSRHRVSATRALSLATKMRNIPAANILLEHGTRCDFEEGDIPIPADVDDPDGDTFNDPLVLGQHTPALVYAVLNHDVAMARILLTHRANPNLGYHGIHCGMRSAFSCGRIVELAMDLRFVEMVQMLLDHGADIGLVSPVWYARGHDCGLIARAVYQRVTASLRAIQSKSLDQ